jgi:hypothetical protein
MLCADLVPASNDSAFQERECGFHSVCMNVPINVNLVPMANGFVLGTFDASANHSFWIGWQFICDHYLNVSTDIFLNVLRQCSGLRILGMEETQITAALPDTNHDLFVIVGSDHGRSSRRSRGFSGQLGSLLPGGINPEITLNQEPGYIFADCSRAQDGAWRGHDHSVDLGTGNGRRFPFPFDPRSRQLLRALR